MSNNFRNEKDEDGLTHYQNRGEGNHSQSNTPGGSKYVPPHLRQKAKDTESPTHNRTQNASWSRGRGEAEPRTTSWSKQEPKEKDDDDSWGARAEREEPERERKSYGRDDKDERKGGERWGSSGFESRQKRFVNRS